MMATGASERTHHDVAQEGSCVVMIKTRSGAALGTAVVVVAG